VKGSNNDGLWNETGASLRVKVSSPPWLSPLAFAFYVLILVVAVYAVATRKSKVVLARKVSELLEVKAALERANAELERLSTSDSLTGLPNRRKLDEELSQRLASAKREKTELSVLMADIDFFKRYNDQYGHGMGDECLKRIAKAMTGALERSTDFVARYGGEEFIVVLPYTNADGAFTVGERIRQTVESLHIPHDQSDVSPYVTISIGVMSILPTPDTSAENILKQADDALYRAKQGGRNCTRF
ncbi:MAG TPA: diguanylate cyclase, partial [Spirochaetia bacterium]|nr:diguanylate cyclase [Spirochaetia bacterium]